VSSVTNRGWRLRQSIGLGRVVVQRRQVVVHEELVDELNLYLFD
jgi:hypothetical protein